MFEQHDSSHKTPLARFIQILFLSTLILLGKPSPTPVPLEDPQTVNTTRPYLGVHTRLNDEVDVWKIKHSLELVREMGAPWIVEFFPWAYHQPEPNRYDWSQADLIIDHAEAQGITVIARLGLIPNWARPPETELNYLDADGYAAFATYAAAFAARYRGRVTHIVVGNEPNLAFEWGGRQTTAADYVALLRAVYPAIKAVNPNTIVLAGALTPTLEPQGSLVGLNDLIYLREMYEAANGQKLFDVLAVHTYGFALPPTTQPAPDVLNFRRVELLREIMLAFDDAETPIFITESGYNDDPNWVHGVTPEQRVHYTLEALTYAENNWPYVEMIALWMFRTPAPTNNYLDYYTLVTPNFTLKELYRQLEQFTDNSNE